jgi:transposase
VRVTTAFNRLLRLPGAAVIDVSFSAEGVIVSVRLRRRRRVCVLCGQTGRQLIVHDRRVKRWRHLDLGSTRCVVECELRLLRCPDCRVVRTEPVPWARPGAHHTRDFEDVVAWLSQQMAKTPIAAMLRVGWDTVHKAMFRAFLLKEELRVLYQLADPALAPAHLDAWLAWASRSRLAPFIKLARTIRRHRNGILAAIRLSLSNGRLEGLNSRIRLISHRSFGFHSAHHSSPSSTSAARASSSTFPDDLHPQTDRSIQPMLL